MLALRRVGASAKATQVAGDPPALGEALHRLGGHPHVQLLADQLVGHAVVVAVHLDVIIDSDPRLLPLRVGEALRRQCAQHRSLQALEQRPTRARQFVEWPLVQPHQKLADGLVELGQRKEGPVAQPRQDPPLHHLHTHLDFGLIPGPSYPRRHHRHPVVHRQVLVGRVQLRLVSARPADSRLQVVRHHHLRQASREFKRPYVRLDPVRKSLAPRRLRIGIVARPPHRDEDLRLPHFAAVGVHHRHGRSAVVDEQLLAGPVHLPHRQVRPRPPFAVQLAIAAIAIAARLLLTVLLPQQLQGHPLLLQLRMHQSPVHRRPLRDRHLGRRRVQTPLQLLVA